MVCYAIIVKNDVFLLKEMKALYDGAEEQYIPDAIQQIMHRNDPSVYEDSVTKRYAK